MRSPITLLDSTILLLKYIKLSSSPNILVAGRLFLNLSVYHILTIGRGEHKSGFLRLFIKQVEVKFLKDKSVKSEIEL